MEKIKEEKLLLTLDNVLSKSLTDKEEIKKLMDHFNTGLYNYSFLNTLLIIWQGGTACNSYNNWQKIERHVKRGEKARIEVLRPNIYQVTVYKCSVGACSNIKLYYKDLKNHHKRNHKSINYNSWYKSLIKEKANISSDGFSWCKTFDVSQTDGKPLEYKHNSKEESELNFNEIKKKIETTFKYKIVIDNKPQRARGYVTANDNTIRINALNNEVDRMKVLFHETAHKILKHTISYSLSEVEAEAVSLMCQSFFNFNTELSESYIAGWNKGCKDINKKRLLSTAEKIIKAVK